MDDPLERLPAAYAAYLRLHTQGQADAVIAERLGLPMESVPMLARLAHAKLARLGDGSVGAATANPGQG